MFQRVFVSEFQIICQAPIIIIDRGVGSFVGSACAVLDGGNYAYSAQSVPCGEAGHWVLHFLNDGHWQPGFIGLSVNTKSISQQFEVKQLVQRMGAA